MRGRIKYSTANQGNGIGCPTAAVPMLPYAMNALTTPTTSVPMREQYLHYNAMQQPDTIIENGYTATFSYYGDRSRAGMTVTGPDGYQYSCDYHDQRYNYFTRTENNVTAHKTVLWLGGSPYSAPAAMLKDYGSDTWRLVHVLRDNLGSITHVVDTAGVVLQQMGYTAWGQLRDPQTGEAYGPDSQPELLLGRGYTGHEHLPWFGLVNMNARLYDPAVGRFLSPDPIVQAPDNTQNFNRYSYCMNNPLRYADILGLIYTTYYDDYTIDGENIRTHRVLDDVVIVGFNNNRNNASMNISFSDGFLPMGSLTFYANWTSQYQVTGNQNKGNGNTFFGGSGGVSAQLRNDPIDWSQYHVVTSPSMPQPYWQSLIIGASGLNQRLGIANGYIKYVFENLSTGDKSKLVYDFSKEIESITGNKIRNYSNLYRNSIPNFSKTVGKTIGFAGFIYTGIDAVFIEHGIYASHIMDVVINSLGFIPVYGWVINGVYYGSNLIIQGVTGKEIGEHLNLYIENEFGLEDGAIKW